MYNELKETTEGITPDTPLFFLRREAPENLMLVRKVNLVFCVFFPGFFLMCGSGLLTKRISLSTLFKISIVGLYFFLIWQIKVRYLAFTQNHVQPYSGKKKTTLTFRTSIKFFVSLYCILTRNCLYGKIVPPPETVPLGVAKCKPCKGLSQHCRSLVRLKV